MPTPGSELDPGVLSHFSDLLVTLNRLKWRPSWVTFDMRKRGDDLVPESRQNALDRILVDRSPIITWPAVQKLDLRPRSPRTLADSARRPPCFSHAESRR